MCPIMSLQGFAKISTTPDLLIYIYKFLDFNDQLKLSCVNVQLFNVFVNFIVKDPYKSLKVVRQANDVLVTSGTHDYTAFLQSDDFKVFLSCYAERVQELNVRRSSKMNDADSNVPFSMIIDTVRFKNLTSLIIENAEIQQKQLEVIARRCPNLQCLELHDCVQPSPIDPCALYRNMLMVGENVSISDLMAIKNLKRLTIQNETYIPPTMKYGHFWELIHAIDFDYLNLKVMIEPDREFYRHSNPPNLKELSITTCFDKNFWSVMFEPFFANFENLTMFTFTLTDIATGATLQLISEVCLNLEILNILHTTFARVYAVLVPPKLKELALEHCTGLRTANLTQILTQLKIIKFTSIATRYKGDFEEFTNSPLVETFLMDSVHRPRDSIYIGNPALKELIWKEGDTCFYEDDYMPNVPWRSCPNLRTLVVVGGFFPVESLLQLNHLTKLHVTIQDNTPLVDWTYIKAILKHPSLIELSIDSLCTDGNCLLGYSVAPVNGFFTTVKVLTVPFEIFEAGLNFWLDIFNQKRHMKIVCSYFCKHRTEFLETLVWHDKLPKFLETIEVWGFTMRCQTLRDNFPAASDKLVYECRKLAPDIKYKNQLIMRRNF